MGINFHNINRRVNESDTQRNGHFVVDGCWPGSNVALTGLVEKGMRILTVNERSLVYMGTHDVTQLMNSEAACHLLLIKYDRAHTENAMKMSTVVVLAAPLGMTIHHNRIVYIEPGGNADASGKVSIGMAIKAVNGKSCHGMARADIKGLVKAALQGGRISIRLSKVWESFLAFTFSLDSWAKGRCLHSEWTCMRGISHRQLTGTWWSIICVPLSLLTHEHLNAQCTTGRTT